MAEQVILSNDIMRVRISSLGAELISVKKYEKELLWTGDPAVWAGHAPLLFPVCGGLKDDKYIYEGKEYTLNKHGYIRFLEFEAESTSDNKAVFLHRYNDETLKQFPFEYELRVIYTLDGECLTVEYDVKNLSEDDMYFSIGAHEGYLCENGIEEYSVIFEKEEKLEANILNGNLLERETLFIGDNIRELPLKYEYFAVDALVFLNLRSKSVVLKNRITGKEIKLYFDGHDYFLLWTKPGASYICMEPWCGIHDFVDSDYSFKDKTGIMKICGKESLSKSHKIVF